MTERIDTDLEAARAERDVIATSSRETTAHRDDRHARYQRLAAARSDLTSALRAFDDGQGGPGTWAPLELAIDRLRAAAHACRKEVP
jgi:hypothetical protein